MIKIAVIWGSHKNDPKFSTHHSFWEETIKDRSDCEMTRFTWSDMFNMPDSFDLYLFLDFNPALYQLPENKYRPRAFYWWDCFHFSFCYPAQVSEIFDRSYYAENLTASALQSQGFRVSWLPPAFYPGLYKPLNIPKSYEYAFVGQQDNVVRRKGTTRKEFLEKLLQSGISGIIQQGVYGENVNRMYNHGKVLFDRTIFNNIGTRFFEAIGSGGFLLVNRAKGFNGMDLLGVDGVHFVSYDDSYEDFEKKLKYFLKNDEERNRIAKQGYDFFLANHTYNNRLTTILNDFGLLS